MRYQAGLAFIFTIELLGIGLQRAECEGPAPASVAQSQITEGRVTSTISFLASDEMAGRATTSLEFNIAAAYVASRFRGAGLEGGANGSYFHETMVDMVQVPNEAILGTYSDQNSESEKALEHLGLLAGSSQKVDVAGPVSEVDLSGAIPDQGLNAIVVGRNSPEMRGPRALSQVARLCTQIGSAGGKLLMLTVAPDSELIEAARGARETPRFDSPQNRFGIPVLLISKDVHPLRTVRVSIPPMQIVKKSMRNVIGVLRGTDAELSKQAVLFSAHLDHLGRRPGTGDGIMNGADDDASGVTAVVTLADAFGSMPRPKRSVLFMTFWGEESGLLGSKQFAASPSWPLEQITANINIEMIGRPEQGAFGKIWMTGWNESDLGRLMSDAAKIHGFEIFEHPSFSARLYRSSDNWSFVQKGVIAHSFSAGSLHNDYHGPDDEWEKLEIPHMTKVIQALFLASQPLVSAEVTPKRN